jgi:hypothetical protein
MDATRATRRTTLWCVLLLALVTAWNVRAVIGFDFVAMDDDINVYFNPHLGPPGTATLKWMFTDAAYTRRYMPLGWLSFSAVYGFSGLSPVGYHVTNLVFHVVNTLVLFVLSRRLLRRWGGTADGTWISVCAALGAALWAWHPYRAETVGWISGLTYGPMATLAMLSVIAYLKVAEHAVGSRARAWWLAATGAAYLASLLFYPISLGLIGVFVLLDVADWYHGPAVKTGNAIRGPSLRRLLGEKAWLALPGFVVLGVTVFMRVVSDSLWAKPVALRDFGWLQRGAQACYAWADYLVVRWWPVKLTPAPTRLLDVQPGDAVFGWSAMLVLGGTVLLALGRTWRRGALLWWLAFLVLLGPMLGFMEHPYFACDRYDYLPGMVLSVAAAFALIRLPRNGRGWAVGAALLVLGGFAWRQQMQLPVWRDMDALERCMIEHSDNRAFSAMQYRNWARHHAAYGAPERSAAILAEGAQQCGGGPWLEEARAEVATASSAAALHTRMAMDFSRAGRDAEAGEHFRRALRIDPRLAAAGINYAVFQAIAGAPLDALHWYFQAVAGSRDGVPAATRFRVLGLIAETFFAGKQGELACRAAEAALRDAPSPADAAALRRQLERYRRTAPPRARP